MDLQLHRGHRKKLAAFIKKWTVPWYAVTALLFAASIPFTIWVFPATTLVLTVVVLFGSFTASVASLASALASEEQEDKTKELVDEVKE